MYDLTVTFLYRTPSTPEQKFTLNLIRLMPFLIKDNCERLFVLGNISIDVRFIKKIVISQATDEDLW